MSMYKPGFIRTISAGHVRYGGERTTCRTFRPDGRLVLNDNGSFTGTALVNYSGASLHTETLAGSYTVDSLCNVSLTYSDGTLHKWTGTLTDKGNGANLIVSETGVVIAGTLRQQKSGGGSE